MKKERWFRLMLFGTGRSYLLLNTQVYCLHFRLPYKSCPKLVLCLTSHSKYKLTREGDTFKTKKWFSFIYIKKKKQVIKLHEDYLYKDHLSCQLYWPFYIYRVFHTHCLTYTILKNVHVLLVFMLQKSESKGKTSPNIRARVTFNTELT